MLLGVKYSKYGNMFYHLFVLLVLQPLNMFNFPSDKYSFNLHPLVYIFSYVIYFMILFLQSKGITFG